MNGESEMLTAECKMSQRLWHVWQGNGSRTAWAESRLDGQMTGFTPSSQSYEIGLHVYAPTIRRLVECSIRTFPTLSIKGGQIDRKKSIP